MVSKCSMSGCHICVGSVPTSFSTEDLSKYYPCCVKECRIVTLNLLGLGFYITLHIYYLFILFL